MATASSAGAGKQHRPVDEWSELNEFETEQASGDQRCSRKCALALPISSASKMKTTRLGVAVE
jgi:hypothetical protein